MGPRLDLTALSKAIHQLEESLDYLDGALAKQDDGLRRQFRAAAILAFEYTYELAIKMIRRQMARIVPNPSDLPKTAFMDLIRMAADAGLARDVSRFGIYREMRNITSHTYEEGKAEEVARSLPQFLDDVRFLRDELARRNRGD